MMTRRGLAVLGISLGLIPVAVALNNLTLGLLATAGLAWMLAAWQSVSRSHVRVSRESTTNRLPEGASAEIRFEVTGEGVHQRIEARQPIPRGVELEGSERIERVLGPGDTAERTFELTTPIRGQYHLPPVEVRTSDPFDLIERVIEIESTTLTLTVLPQRVRPREAVGRPRHTTPRPGVFTSLNSGSGSEFYSIREYMPNDALRLVNWKASAAKNELMVNEYHDERVTQTVALIDHRLRTGAGSFSDAPIHEVARGGALVFQSAFEGGDKFMGLLVGDAPEILQGESGRAFKNRMMNALAEVEPEGDCPLELAIKDSLHAIQEGAKVVVLSPLCYASDKDGIMSLLARECTVTVVVPDMPEPTNEAQQAWIDQHEENVRTMRGLGVHIVETPMGILSHALGEGVKV